MTVQFIISILLRASLVSIPREVEERRWGKRKDVFGGENSKDTLNFVFHFCAAKK
jgi:hypothetical protein